MSIHTSRPLHPAAYRPCHLDLATLDLTHEDLLIRRRLIAVARPAPRDVERLAGIAARLEREAGR
jgi:hypothetical protein